MSFKTSRNRFGVDAERCQNSCESPARLFVYPNPGGAVEYMHDLQGRAYTSLENAFLYRTEYKADCRCKPHPWTEEARMLHEERVLAEQERQEQEHEEAKARAAERARAMPKPRRRGPRARRASRRNPQQTRRRRGLFRR